jgi:hypothetical protein
MFFNVFTLVHWFVTLTMYLHLTYYAPIFQITKSTNNLLKKVYTSMTNITQYVSIIVPGTITKYQVP